MSTSTDPPNDPQKLDDVLTQVQNLRQRLNDQFLERSDVIDGLLVAIIARANVFIGGPAGTGKSALAQALCGSIDGGQYFQRLVSKFSTPEELFGPIKISALKEDRFERKIDRYLPTAHVAFLDEIFKANSAILNSLLTILNERAFDNDCSRLSVPLVSLIGASNELPDDHEGLAALWDRFQMRFWVDYLQHPLSFERLIKGEAGGKVEVRIDLDSIRTLQDAAMKIPFANSFFESVQDLRRLLQKEGFMPSDRKWVQAMQIVRTHALLMGSTCVEEEHLEVLQNVFWDKPKDRSAIRDLIFKVGNPVKRKILQILDMAKEEHKHLTANYKPSDKDRPTWLASASTGVQFLKAQVKEVDSLLASYKGNDKSVLGAKARIEALYTDLTKKITDLFA